jgi:hypothetical protein
MDRDDALLEITQTAPPRGGSVDGGWQSAKKEETTATHESDETRVLRAMK